MIRAIQQYLAILIGAFCNNNDNTIGHSNNQTINQYNTIILQYYGNIIINFEQASADILHDDLILEFLSMSRKTLLIFGEVKC